MKHSKKQRTPNAGMGLAIGGALGVGIGAALENLPVGILFGIAIGLAFDAYRKGGEDE
ncbi:glycine zipper family protein [Indiicoccus explosivorum]|uniref:glycine zipper family protein n=1 Tax=Indiicoccus explosivorum TaxID=1917864 RepID=UPI001F4F018C|nr:glycine zipper family protein [Indiicoccus explosivorum]